jgi:hypothetical protein
VPMGFVTTIGGSVAITCTAIVAGGAGDAVGTSGREVALGVAETGETGIAGLQAETRPNNKTNNVAIHASRSIISPHTIQFQSITFRSKRGLDRLRALLDRCYTLPKPTLD